ncbi:hypothetical protein BDV36DRAFT_183627 [Aspergillus pseudocaelatus]|uniref:Uncharacterized protein n=1 Tax=Aspergillus pseudocaelatus TaxID=1825620 RepID=A0ABQ6WJK8_9EURO|nr:hypothetical protein BDV36DRAFT_183627 [Aspergillus pseudocaelatus]
MALFHQLLTSKELTSWSPRAQQELCRLGFIHHFVFYTYSLPTPASTWCKRLETHPTVLTWGCQQTSIPRQNVISTLQSAHSSHKFNPIIQLRGIYGNRHPR